MEKASIDLDLTDMDIRLHITVAIGLDADEVAKQLVSAFSKYDIADVSVMITDKKTGVVTAYTTM